MGKKRVGIVGCGAIFDRHLEAINSNNDYFELVAICDIDRRKLDIRSKEYRVPGYVDYKDMLAEMKGKMDFVTVATPNSIHFDQAVDALNSGYDILVEKPVDFKHPRVEEISRLAKSLRRQAYAVLQVRYNPTIGLVKQVLQEGLLGDIRSVSLIQRWQRPSTYFDSWRADINVGGRILYEVGIHYLDIVQLLFGLPKALASATFNNKHKHVEFEDTVFSMLEFPGGVSGSIEVTIAAEPSNLECSLSIMGSEGFMKVGGKALDKVERAAFISPLLEKKWADISSGADDSLEPNSYGTHQGSCPNHPTLYREIAEGRGLAIEETVNSIRFIEDIYSREIERD